MISIKSLIIVCVLLVCVVIPVLYSILVTVLYLVSKKKVTYLERQLERLREYAETGGRKEVRQPSSKQKAGFTSENLNR